MVHMKTFYQILLNSSSGFFSATARHTITDDLKCSIHNTANFLFRKVFLLTFQFIRDDVKISSIPICQTPKISPQKIGL